MKLALQKSIVVSGIIFSTFVVAASTSHAQVTSYSIESFGSQLGLGTADLKQTVINIVNLSLGLMALVAVTMVIIGGFTWMTAGGNEEKVDKAKKIISAAVIGIVIVLLAWAVVLFVAKTTSNVTTSA